MRAAQVVFSIALGLSPASCDGADGRSADGGVADAASPLDGAAADAMAPATIYGGPCDDDSVCGLGGFCLDEEDDWPAAGYCSKSGCLTDVACGPGAFCGADNNCYPRCADDQGCALAGQICSRVLGGTQDFGQPGCFPGRLAVDGAPCESFADCHPSQYCDRDPWRTPGGYCTTAGCVVGDDRTCNGDGHCFEFVAGSPVCVDVCTTDGDCRQDDGYGCFTSVDPALGSFCAVTTATGDACVDDSCGVAPWQCLTDASFPGADLPGGSCGALCVPDAPGACDVDAVCHDPDAAVAGDEHCVRRCTPASQAEVCRVAEGYLCKDLDGAGPGTERGCIQ